MTDPRGRIPPWGWFLRAFLLAAAAGLGVTGCNDPPPEAPVPPGEIVRPRTVDVGVDEDAIEPGLGRTDAWYDAYFPYMSPEMRREYLATPEDERFDRFGLALLDFQLREDLLREHEDVLTSDDKELYRRLRTADDCRRFVRDRLSGVDVAPIPTRSRGQR